MMKEKKKRGFLSEWSEWVKRSEWVNETEIAKRMRVEQIHVRLLLHSQINDREKGRRFFTRGSVRVGNSFPGTRLPRSSWLGSETHAPLETFLYTFSPLVCLFIFSFVFRVIVWVFYCPCRFLFSYLLFFLMLIFKSIQIRTITNKNLKYSKKSKIESNWFFFRCIWINFFIKLDWFSSICDLIQT